MDLCACVCVCGAYRAVGHFLGSVVSYSISYIKKKKTKINTQLRAVNYYPRCIHTHVRTRETLLYVKMNTTD